MTIANQKKHSLAALLLVAFLGVVMGNLSFPFLSPHLAQEMGSASLRLSLLLTGRLHTATIVPQIHFVASATGGLLALALWELYCCLTPLQQTWVSKALFLAFKHPALHIGLLLLLVVPFGFLHARHSDIPAPSDDVLIANFHKNRQAFEQVRQMLNDTPQLEPVTTMSTDGADILSLRGTDYVTYQEQLADAGLKNAHFLSAGSRICGFELPPLMSDTEVQAMHETKAYIYSESPLYSSWRDNPSCTYRHIEGHWYLCIRSQAQ